MNRLPTSIITLATLGVFCATLTYWVITLTTSTPLPAGADVTRAPANVDDAARLFGDDRHDSRIRLSGILALGAGRGAAAIVSVDGAPSQAIGIGQSFDRNVTLSEVKAHSIVVDRGGVRSEVPMTVPTGGPNAGAIVYMH